MCSPCRGTAGRGSLGGAPAVTGADAWRTPLGTVPVDGELRAATVEADAVVLDACSADALRSLLAHARRAGWTCTLIDVRTSAEASGDFRHVVGYGAFALVATSATGARAAPRER